LIRAGLIINPKSHRNRRAGGRRGHAPGGVLTAAPQTPAELDAALADFAARGIDLLIIDGGDGTLRDVLTLAPLHFGDAEPAFAALPSGKTNALAIALNTPRDWPIEAALARAQAGAFTPLSPLEVRRARERKPPQRGFLFGAGAFRRATADAEAAHRLGAFGSLAIGLTLAGSVLQTLAGRGGWATGEPMTLALTVRRQIPPNCFC
jgi:diacylglycerol kinase family enzyme